MAEELLPINNISYHFIKTSNGCTSEKVISTSITCKNFDELLNDLKSKKEFIHKNKYSDIYITCSSMNKDLYSSTYLWHTDYVNSNKIYKLSLFDIIMSSKQTIEKIPKETKLVNSIPKEIPKKEIPKETKPVDSIPKEIPVDDMFKVKKAINPFEQIPINQNVQPSLLKNKSTPKTKPETNNSNLTNNSPESMDLSDIFKLLSKKLPMKQDKSESNLSFDINPNDIIGNTSSFDPNPEEDIIITSNKSTKPKEPEKKPEPKDDYSDVKCFNVRFPPDNKPEIVKIPFSMPTNSTEKKSEQTQKKPEQISEKKLEQEPKKKLEQDSESFYNFIKFLSDIIEETEKKSKTKLEKKPETQPKSESNNVPQIKLRNNEQIPTTPFKVPNVRRVSKDEPKKCEKCGLNHPTSTRFNPTSNPSYKVHPTIRPTHINQHPFMFDRMEQSKQEMDPFMRMFFHPEQNYLNDNEIKEKARKRARESSMEMFPFIF